MESLTVELSASQGTLLRFLANSGEVQVDDFIEFFFLLLCEREEEEVATRRFVNTLSKPLFSNFEVPVDSNRYGSSEEEIMKRRVDGALHLLEGLGVIELSYRTLLGFGTKYRYARLTARGKEVADKFRHGRRPLVRLRADGPKTVFVATAFGRDDVDLLYREQFSKSCVQIGFTPVRIDAQEPSGTITDAIIQHIDSAAAVIVDLTYARPSVYFEAGFALRTGAPVLLTCRRDHFRGRSDDLRVHFDLEQFKISFWTYSRGKFHWQDQLDPLTRLRQVTSQL